MADERVHPSQWSAWEWQRYNDRKELEREAMSDGHTVALPLTQEQARNELVLRIAEAGVPSWEWALAKCIDAVLSAPPEVIAAAMGGRLELLNDAYAVASPGAGGYIPCIVLPPREADPAEPDDYTDSNGTLVRGLNNG